MSSPKVKLEGPPRIKLEGSPKIKVEESSKVKSEEGVAHNVDILYITKESGEAPDYFANALGLIKGIHENKPAGDILFFLPGEEEIEEFCLLLSQHISALEILPLYESLSQAKQEHVFASCGRRKCIVTTNNTETIVQIDGIVYVVDTLLSKQKAFNPRARVKLLHSGPISKASADQRASLAGRTRDGMCFRLCTEETFASLAPWTKPSILTDDLTTAVLQSKADGYGDVLSIDFTIPPGPDQILCALERLNDWQYVDHRGDITARGRVAADFPIHPKWYQAICVAADHGCGIEMLTIAAIVNSQSSIFAKPSGQRPVAELAHAQFACPSSDHITVLNAFHAWWLVRDEGKCDLAQWCSVHYLDGQALEEIWVSRKELVATLGFELPEPSTTSPWDHKYERNIKKALARSFYSQVAYCEEGDLYRTIPGNWQALLLPDSALASARWEWVVYDSIISSGKTYLDLVTAIRPEWLVDLAFFNDENWMPKAGSKAELAKRAFMDAKERV